MFSSSRLIWVELRFFDLSPKLGGAVRYRFSRTTTWLVRFSPSCLQVISTTQHLLIRYLFISSLLHLTRLTSGQLDGCYLNRTADYLVCLSMVLFIILSLSTHSFDEASLSSFVPCVCFRCLMSVDRKPFAACQMLSFDCSIYLFL